jgi:hypothetical protein
VQLAKHRRENRARHWFLARFFVDANSGQCIVRTKAKHPRGLQSVCPRQIKAQRKSFTFSTLPLPFMPGLIGQTDVTSVADILVPEIWLPYMMNRSVELSELWQAGIVERSPEFDALAGAGGQTVNMPFWNDLSGDDQVLTSGGSLTTKKLTTGKDLAVIHNRGDAWSYNDLAGLLAGSDPAAAIADLVGDYWARKSQGQLFSTLSGIFSIASMSANVADIAHTSGGVASLSNCFTGETFVDAKQKLGDHKSLLTAIAMHSATEASLVKQDLIDNVPASDGKTMLKFFQGLRVIVDDTMPVRTRDSDLSYTSYIFGRGAIGLGLSNFNQAAQGGTGSWQLEFARDALKGESVMINRRRFLLHPRGIKWLNASMAGESPTNAELAASANWLRVFDPKKIRVVKFEHNIL